MADLGIRYLSTLNVHFACRISVIDSPVEFFSTPAFEGGGGVIFSKSAFQFLTKRNSDQAVTKLSLLGQRTRHMVYAMSSLES